MLTPGERIGPFVVEDTAGEGQCGVVFRVRHQQNGETYALKVLLTPSAYAAERFSREAEALRQLKHANIVRVFGTMRVKEKPALVLGWVDGGTLGEWRAKHPPPLARLTLFEHVLRGAAAAHLVGLVHRDLKPSNILVERTHNPRIADFGLVKLLDAESPLTRTGAMLGTLGYMAPELFLDAKHVDSRADIFSLGAILYWLLSGRMAFPSLNRAQNLDDVRNRRWAPLPGDALQETLAACLDPDPAARPPTCAAVSRLLQGAWAAA